MSGNFIKILDSETKDEITKLYGIKNPLISEELNGKHIFTFDTIPSENLEHLVYPNLVEVDNDYFTIARILKNRGSVIGISVECEHVSYLLGDEPIFTKEYEGTPAEIVEEMITVRGSNMATRDFVVGEIYYTDEVIFTTDKERVRDQLFDFVNYLQGELYINKYTVNILGIRSESDNLKFEIGLNLRELTSEMIVIDGKPRHAYEVDVVDLGYMDIGEGVFPNTIELGDRVGVVDGLLGVVEELRIITYERNPFQKAVPRIQIGNVIHDITDVWDKKEDKVDNKSIKVHMMGFATVSLDLEIEEGNGAKKGNVWTEWATVPFADTVTIHFSQKYRSVPSVNVHAYGGSATLGVDIITSNENGLIIYTGVIITVKSGFSTDITMHAIGRV